MNKLFSSHFLYPVSLSHFGVQIVSFSDRSFLQISGKDCLIKLEIWSVMTNFLSNLSIPSWLVNFSNIWCLLLQGNAFLSQKIESRCSYPYPLGETILQLLIMNPLVKEIYSSIIFVNLFPHSRKGHRKLWVSFIKLWNKFSVDEILDNFICSLFGSHPPPPMNLQ